MVTVNIKVHKPQSYTKPQLKDKGSNTSWSSPRKEKNSKPLRGKTEFLANETVKVNPLRGKTRRNPQEGISADCE